MMRLPALLQPWSAWLAPFPADLAGSLGTLLLRLAPLLGPLRRHAAPQAHEPAGIGDIVRRGSYDRLLISEWALADAVPEEFMRRAAGGELLFTGPEPANSEESLHSVVLFDAGPAQLGEARLVHMAMLILLARRAAMAGAEFHWGVLQAPGTLHAGADQDAMRRLLDARTWAALDADGLLQWNAALGDAGGDCWLVGDADAPLPAAVQSRVLVQRAWLADELEVTLSQRRRSRTVTLPLPRPEDSVRLLRRPFDAPVTSTAAVLQAPHGSHSLKRAPLFGTERGWLATPMVDGSVTLYNVPHSPQGKAGRARNRGTRYNMDGIIAAGLFHKAFGMIVRHNDLLYLAGFPGPFFYHSGNGAIPVPDPSQFQAVPGALRWMPVFHLTKGHPDTGIFTEQVCVIDKGSRLVAWTRERNTGDDPRVRTTFRQIAGNVLQAVQLGTKLYFAVGLAERTDIYRLDGGDTTPRHLRALTHCGNSFFFGDLKGWRNGYGIYLMRLDGNEWLAGERDAATTLRIDTHATVLGVARRTRVGVPGLEAPAAVVLQADRRRIALHTGDKAITLVDASEHIAQASFDPLTNRVAWLGRDSGALTVVDIGTTEVLLRALPQERGGHES